MHRFFISPERIAGDVVEFPPDLSRQMHRVLRMSAGDPVVALDNTGYEYAVALSSVDSDRTLGAGHGPDAWFSRASLPSDPLPSGDEVRPVPSGALQKGTELGVGRFVPVVTLRTMRRDASPSSNRRERWMRIIREAAEQSERSVLPELGEPVLLKEALGRAPRPMIPSLGARIETLHAVSLRRTVRVVGGRTKPFRVRRTGGRVRSGGDRAGAEPRSGHGKPGPKSSESRDCGDCPGYGHHARAWGAGALPYPGWTPTAAGVTIHSRRRLSIQDAGLGP